MKPYSFQVNTVSEIDLNNFKQTTTLTKMTRSTKEVYPRVANRDRHVSRNGPWNAKPMKKMGGGKGNWGVEGDEVDDFQIPVKQVFKDSDYRDVEVVDSIESSANDNNKIRVVSREELESSSSSEE